MLSPFSYRVKHTPQKTRIKIKFLTPHLNTKSLPHTFDYLSQNIPAVLKSKCFNNQNRPFNKAVKKTEIGHLFEHILLENLTFLLHIPFSGKTSWDWTRQRRGTFDIQISGGKNYKPAFEQALATTSKMISEILTPRHL